MARLGMYQIDRRIQLLDQVATDPAAAEWRLRKNETENALWCDSYLWLIGLKTEYRSSDQVARIGGKN